MATPAQDPTAPIEADDSSYSSSDFEGSIGSSTASLSSSILEHVYENGRLYHRKSEDKYLMPSDEMEKDRLDLVHHSHLLILGGELHKAPLKGSPHNVLDCGTGTGIWALDFGEIHPASKVIGVDLAPIQPAWTFPNVRFETDDLEKDWTFKKDYFDFIHSRTVGASIKDWKKYTQQMFEHCAPGGYVEIAEHSLDYPHCDDNTVPEDSGLRAYFRPLAEGLKKLGTSVHLFSGDWFKSLLEEAGFTEVEVYTYKVPWGTWPKSKNSKYLGAVYAEIASTGAEAYGLLLMTKILGMSKEEATEVCIGLNKAMRSGKEHAYNLQWHVVAKKPEA